MATKTNETSGFEILLDALAKPDWRDGLFNAQTLAYRYLQTGKERDIKLSMAIIPPVTPNVKQYYLVLENKIDNYWDNNGVQQEMQMLDSALAASVRAVVHRKSHARPKYQKKQMVRIKREVKKMWNSNKYGGRQEIYKAIKLMHFLFREAFVILRKSLKEDAYNAIPDVLQIGGSPVKKSTIFEYHKDRKVFYLMNDNLGGYDAWRELQFQIAPYIVRIVNRRYL